MAILCPSKYTKMHVSLIASDFSKNFLGEHAPAPLAGLGLRPSFCRLYASWLVPRNIPAELTINLFILFKENACDHHPQKHSLLQTGCMLFAPNHAKTNTETNRWYRRLHNRGRSSGNFENSWFVFVKNSIPEIVCMVTWQSILAPF